jgi:hypothetical protein
MSVENENGSSSYVDELKSLSHPDELHGDVQFVTESMNNDDSLSLNFFCSTLSFVTLYFTEFSTDALSKFDLSVELYEFCVSIEQSK